MKNVRHLLVAVAALVSFGTMAFVQPGVPASEDNPMRISAGAVGGLHKPADGFGLDGLGAGIGFSHNVGYDFEYGLAVGGAWVSHKGNIFTDAGKKSSGVGMGVEAMARFMPELAEKFHLGGLLAVGWGHQFGEGAKELNDNIKFGDLGVKVGPSMSFGFSDMVSLYLTLALSMNKIRFLKDSASQDLKDNTNTFGAEAPLGLWVAVADNTAMFLEANTRFTNFKKFGQSWNEVVTLGVSFAM